jgi:hypothetical protein
MKIDGLPIKNGWIFHGKLLNNQMVHILVGGLEHDFFEAFPSYWECHHPN